MHKELKALADTFASYRPAVPDVSDDAWKVFAEKVQVVIPAGGESKRLRGVTREGYNKISMPLPNGDTLLEYNIRMYRDAGLRRFILLVGHASHTVEKLIGD